MNKKAKEMMLSKHQLSILLIVTFIVLFLTEACAIPNSSRVIIQTITHTPYPTGTLSLHIIEPLVNSPRLRFDSWSPDSRWIAYWFADGDNLPAHLAFVEAQSGKVCEHEEVDSVDIFSGNVLWVEGNTPITVQNSGKVAFSGVPCETFPSVDSSAIFEKEEGRLSPNGRYRADTSVSDWEGELIHNVTTITEISTDQIVASLKWDGSPHAWAESGWLNNELYLVGLDVDRGALYVSAPEGKVGSVVHDLMGLNVQNVGYVTHVARYTNLATGEYHLLFELWNGPPGSPLLLYHSELDIVEELPFYRSWIVNGSGISSDGEWLFLSYPASKLSDEIPDFWIRALDPPDRTALKLAEGKGFAGFSEESSKMVFVDKGVVDILDFPGGETFGIWQAPGYQIDRAWWSSDGKYLAVQGFGIESDSQTLFVIEP